MFVPIRSDYKMSSPPVVNYLLVAVNVAVFVLGFHGSNDAASLRINDLMLHPEAPEIYQFFTSMFLHQDWMHLISNMIFLWVFGNAVNDRLGHAGYIAFYLGGGLFAAVGFLMLGATGAMLGASGAISAVTGAYLVLLPRARITVLMFLYFITFFDVSSLYFLLFQFITNVYMSYANLRNAGGGVAFGAHAAGYVYGIVLAVGLLATRLLPRDMFDLLALAHSWQKRRQFRRMASEGYGPFITRTPAPGAPPLGRVEAPSFEPPPPGSPANRELQLRRDVATACAAHDLPAAARGYLQLLQIADDGVLPQAQQLDVANHLMFTQNHPAAADAYERFLKHYPIYQHIGDIYLMLGLLYGRYLFQPDRAQACLDQAIVRLSDPRKLELARNDLANLRKQRGK
ncbi:MAG: rhomboid family intramembrane serine protease [Planctomycetota bacterium]|nr:rhomboid family intramembrane serine protease [Planctomycetota bacterium]